MKNTVSLLRTASPVVQIISGVASMTRECWEPLSKLTYFKRIKYLRTNRTKEMKDLYTCHYKKNIQTQRNERHATFKNWKNKHCKKMAILPKITHYLKKKSNLIPIKVPMTLLKKID